MATEGRTTVAVPSGQRTDRRHCSFFELPPGFFDFSRLVSPGTVAGAEKQSFLNSVGSLGASLTASKIADDEEVEETINGDEGAETDINSKEFALPSRLSCNTCKAEFDSLVDQRSHFKSDLHRLNVKLSHAGKNTVKEEDFDELTSDTFSRDFDVSSISGSEDEEDKASYASGRVSEGLTQNLKQKLVVSLQSGERVSLWKCFILKDSEDVLYESEQSAFFSNGAYLRENDVVQKLKELVHEPKVNGLRVVLLARGGHFAGCVFGGNKVVAHKTFHRYVVRAKAGKKQSTKDGSGKSIHSAGANLRRYNELALKKDIQDLLASWKSYFDTSSCVFVQAPSSNRQLFFIAEKALVGNKHCDIRNIPSTVRRPTLKEAQRVYNQLSQVTYEIYEKETHTEEKLVSDTANITSECPGYKDEVEVLNNSTHFEASSSIKVPDEQSVFEEIESEAVCTSTPLHEAAKSGDAILVLELLEKGLDPTLKNERGKTPYMLADDKEMRNNFRRFMAENLDKWDWNAAKVPSALTKEMEESQAAKQAEKDAKRKAKAKELKKLRKAREKEKKEQAEAAAAVAQSQKESTVSQKRGELRLPARRVKPQSSAVASVSKEEELRRKLVEDREKRAAAAERRIAAAAAVSPAPQGAGSAVPSGTSQRVIPGSTDEMACSCCKASMIDKVPFHRYNYKYCSTTCMHVHKEFLEDG